MRKKREGFLWGSAFFSSSLLFCRVQNQVHTLLECWRSVSPQVPALLPSGSWWEALIVKCWIVIEGSTTLGHLLWTNLQLGPVTYELKLNSILAWDFVHFYDTCLLVLCFSFFSFSSNIPQSLGKKSILILLILLLIFLLLILLLLFQPHHRHVGSAVQALNSVFLSVLLRHNT